MLPALALGVGFATNFLLTGIREFRPRWVRGAVVAVFALVGLNLSIMLHHRPVVYVEGTKNASARRPYERAIASALRAELDRRPGAVVLMDTSVYPQIVAMSGIPLRQTINESDREYYHAALEAPAQHASIVLALAGDPIEKAVREHPAGLTEVGGFSAPWQPSITLYVSDTPRGIGAHAVPRSVVASAKENLR
jgi:hypothetical protein